MREKLHFHISRSLSLVFSCLLLGLFAHDVAAKVKPARRSATTSPCPQETQPPPSPPQEPLQEETIQEEMQKYLGIRYKRGGDSTKGFDCSGFVKQIYSELFGVDLPHQSSEQHRFSLLTKVPSDELKTGDLVFFSGGRNRKGIRHVGIYLSDGRFIHSARTKGVVISSIGDRYWKSRLVSAKRLVNRESLMASADSETTFGLGAALDDNTLLTFQVAAAQAESFPPSPVHNELLQLSRESSYRTEFNLLKGLWVDSWTARLTAFREHFSVDQEDPFFSPRPILGGSDFSSNALSANYSQGLRLAGDIRPIEWLRVSPSVTYFDYGRGVDFSDLPRVALGLDFNLASSSEGWSLSTGFQYPLSRFTSTRLSVVETGDTHSIDMSLTFRQWLTDHVQFSVTGERFYRTSSGPDGDDHQVSFALHFFY